MTSMVVDLELRLLPAQAAGALAATLVVPPAHPLLAGHFPGAPLVAGVQLLEAACRVASATTGQSFAIVAVDDVRWFQPVAPGAEVGLAAALRADGSAFACEGEWSGPAGRVAAFRLRLQAAPSRP